jgi:hypothetical protein
MSCQAHDIASRRGRATGRQMRQAVRRTLRLAGTGRADLLSVDHLWWGQKGDRSGEWEQLDRPSIHVEAHSAGPELLGSRARVRIGTEHVRRHVSDRPDHARPPAGRQPLRADSPLRPRIPLGPGLVQLICVSPLLHLANGAMPTATAASPRVPAALTRASAGPPGDKSQSANRAKPCGVKGCPEPRHQTDKATVSFCHTHYLEAMRRSTRNTAAKPCTFPGCHEPRQKGIRRCVEHTRQQWLPGRPCPKPGCSELRWDEVRSSYCHYHQLEAMRESKRRTGYRADKAKQRRRREAPWIWAPLSPWPSECSVCHLPIDPAIRHGRESQGGRKLNRPGSDGGSTSWRKMESCQITPAATRPRIAIQPS